MRVILLLFVVIGINSTLWAQTEGSWYLVTFKDKSNSHYSISKPEAFLSNRALTRRLKQQIVIDSTDIPVNQNYIDSIRNSGFSVKHALRWINAITILATDTQKLNILKHKSFIQSIKYCGNYSLNSNARFSDSEGADIAPHAKSKISTFDYGQSTAQTVQCNGNMLHNKGFTGAGMWIAILDGGFFKANIYPAFDSLWIQKRVLGQRDFVRSNENFFDTHSHGMSVLSVMAGNLPGELIGSCPHASYLLVRTEDTESESPVEENNWMAAAEYADSLGVDVINSSLGYSRFDDKTLNHKYADLNGNTTIISKAASMAASKGILVIVSAGNERNGDWKYLSAPADAKHVLTIGAVDNKGKIASFSSAGPTSDRRVKPDVVGMGYQTALQTSEGKIATGNGTSFSSPLIAGFATCLWQALPELSVKEIIALIDGTANRSFSPDSLYGYGIPDFDKALAHGNQLIKLRKDRNAEVYISPSPFSNFISLTFVDSVHTFYTYDLISIDGKRVTRGNIVPGIISQVLDNPVFSSLRAGVYILNLKNKLGHEVILKLIHL